YNIVNKGYAPIVVHYEKPEKHFALLLGFNNGRAIMIDPARGMESLSKDVFLERYSGLALILASTVKQKDVEAIKEALDWAAGKQACLEQAVRRVGKRW
ncbi:MAG TPA: cysteine peptidase family C39 domain-containing protein, partial [Spirochaetales bacterium]|nr:cysteine peptidase family C39 domain-containing protein [Spirochaetales bacterium]